MKVISQKIPVSQQEILIEALDLMQNKLKSLNSEDTNIQYKLFDVMTLKAMLNNTELVVNIPFKTYDNFTSINRIDYPEYAE